MCRKVCSFYDNSSNIALDLRILKQPCGECKECKRVPSRPTPSIVRFPATVALKFVLARACSTPHTKMLSLESLSEDARLVLQACQDLERRRDEDKTVLDSGLYFTTAKEVVPTLSYITRLKLSLATWNFTQIPLPVEDPKDLKDLEDLEGLEDLDRFLRQGRGQAVWQTLHTRYQDRTGIHASFNEFMKSFDFLLLPTLWIGPS